MCNLFSATRFFRSNAFISNIRLKLEKYQAKTKQQPEAELLFICNEQHLSNIWGLNHEKVKQHWGWVEKNRCLQKHACKCRWLLPRKASSWMFDCFYRMLASNKHFLCFITEDFLSWKKACNAWIHPYSWVYFSRRCNWLKKGWASREGNGLSFIDRIAEQMVLVITQVWKESKLSIHWNLPKSETGRL